MSEEKNLTFKRIDDTFERIDDMNVIPEQLNEESRLRLIKSLRTAYEFIASLLALEETRLQTELIKNKKKEKE